MFGSTSSAALSGSISYFCRRSAWHSLWNVLARSCYSVPASTARSSLLELPSPRQLGISFGGNISLTTVPESGGEIRASRIAFALGGELCLYFSGYDPRWRKYGVMTTLMVETIKWAIEQGFVIINLSAGSMAPATRSERGDRLIDLHSRRRCRSQSGHGRHQLGAEKSSKCSIAH